MASKIVAVTGANGFVASELVRQLLDRGFTVRGLSPLSPPRVFTLLN